MVSMNEFSCILSVFKISLFVFFCVHDISNILQYYFSSKAFIFFSLDLFSVHVSQPYVATGNTHALSKNSCKELLMRYHEVVICVSFCNAIASLLFISTAQSPV